MLQHFQVNSYDLIHLHSIWFFPSLVATFFRKNAKLITTIHGVYPDNKSSFLKIVLFLYKPFAAYILHSCNRIIVLSNSEKEKLMQLFRVKPLKIHVIPNAIEINTEKIERKNDQILFTGRLIKDKNPDLLIKAFAQIKNQLPNYKVIFVGPINEAYKDELCKLAKRKKVLDSIKFVGPLNPLLEKDKKLLFNYYKKSKIFVSLGSWEGLPTRLLEAMSYKNVCISYASGGTSELIRNRHDGFILKKLDSVELGKIILEIAENSEMQKNIGENAHDKIEKKFNCKNQFKTVKKLYDEVLNG
jgi:glycosyltransferase involved in cell wall biosynthesis